MRKALLIAFVLVGACKGKEPAPQAEKPTEAPAPKPTEAPAPKPAEAPAPKPAEAPPAAAATPIAGFNGAAQVDLPTGYAVSKHESEDGEGDAVLAKKDGVTIEFVGTEESVKVSMAEHAKFETSMGKLTWKQQTEDADGFVLVFERKDGLHVAVFRTGVHGFCSADKVPADRVDEVIAICKTLRPA